MIDLLIDYFFCMSSAAFCAFTLSCAIVDHDYSDSHPDFHLDLIIV